MDWITGIQAAINYIEDHLTEELDYEVIAGKSFSSSAHFQRIFSILCGYTLGEYIRNRRLTLAGAQQRKFAEFIFPTVDQNFFGGRYNDELQD